MNKYIGTKSVRAKPMTRLAYNQLRGWQMPEDENGDDQGYLVEYLDGGKPNLQEYEGYISWSPKEQFDNAYRIFNNMTFGLAIEALKQGKKVARKGWNGKGMWLILTKMYTHTLIEQGGYNLNYVPFITMKTADDKFVPWLASQRDLLAEDWVIVE